MAHHHRAGITHYAHAISTDAYARELDTVARVAQQPTKGRSSAPWGG